MKLYFAGPLFNEAERRFNKDLTHEIEALGIEVFLPQRDGDAVNQEPIISMSKEDRARAIFNLDREHLVDSDVFLYILDGRVPDEGAAVALGMAYMNKSLINKKVKLVGLHTDKRSAFMGEALNPMIFSSLDYIAKDIDDLLTYLHSGSISIKDLWADYLYSLDESIETTDKAYEAWAFGLGVDMANELGDLVLSGKKCATASLHYLYEVDDEEIPKLGDHSIILDGYDHPRCVIKTTAVDLVPFKDVTADFARKEGEGDLSLNYWRQGHERFFKEELEAYDKAFDENMLVVCEQFEVVYKVERARGQEFEIQGLVLLGSDISLDDVNDKLIDFVEANGWYFGGGVKGTPKKNTVEIAGCISMETLIAPETFNQAFEDFLLTQEWFFQGHVKEIIDGYYMNGDGSRGRHVSDDQSCLDADLKG